MKLDMESRFLISLRQGELLSQPLALKLDRGQVAQRGVEAFGHVNLVEEAPDVVVGVFLFIP
jgi:hypothetical protein